MGSNSNLLDYIEARRTVEDAKEAIRIAELNIGLRGEERDMTAAAGPQTALDLAWAKLRQSNWESEPAVEQFNFSVPIRPINIERMEDIRTGTNFDNTVRRVRTAALEMRAKYER